jgi:predicted nucleic acid-binding protein
VSFGSPVPTNDAWIAAIAAREGADLHDHFDSIERIGVRRLV